MDDIDLSGHVALVTGAGSGLGRSHALTLARYGADVVVNDLRPLGREDHEAITSTVDEILGAGGKSSWIQGDVGHFEQARNMVDHTVETFGRLDILVNNAGIFRPAPFGETDMSDFEAELRVHLIGAANMTRAAWPVMQRQGYGRVVMTTSSSVFGSPTQAAYAAAKMGVLGLVTTLTLEGEPHGIRVNAIMPCARSKELEAGFREEFAQAMDPSFASEGLVFLASEAAPARCVLFAGGGGYSTMHLQDSGGVFLGRRASASTIRDRFAEIDALSAPKEYSNVIEHISKFNSAIGISEQILRSDGDGSTERNSS